MENPLNDHSTNSISNIAPNPRQQTRSFGSRGGYRGRGRGGRPFNPLKRNREGESLSPTAFSIVDEQDGEQVMVYYKKSFVEDPWIHLENASKT
ncbi:uncharacterized protein VTP21DRAFT_11044 [Calcarisporiella thermophila]|uniref:uncharacterized protein n=1 Tax=Calcarisporiella thermophila TaxID=911321 RepID=UPI0037421C7C